MTTQQIQEQAENLEMTVSQDPENLQEAVQSLAQLVAQLCEKVKDINANLNEFHGRANE